MKDKISPVPWINDAIGVRSSDRGWYILTDEDTSIADREAIISAINATYGNGINPEAVTDMYKAILDIISYEERCRATGNPALSDHWYRPIKAAIEKAKL